MTSTKSERVISLEEFKDKTKDEAEILVKQVFPQKVIMLHDLLNSAKFSPDRIKEFSNAETNIPYPETIMNNDEPALKKRKQDGGEAGTPVYALPNGIAPTNEPISELIEIVKPHIRTLITHANQVKMWIAYMIPRIEDGNNFGVSIQEDALAETRQVEAEVAAYLDQISRYYMTRAKVVSKIAKYPHVEDYRRTVKELDEKEFVSMRLVLCELRNQYATLHDLIIKNIDKIKKPRTTNTDGMY